MPAYFDSSVVLSLVLGDVHANRAHELWHDELERVSSILLDVECTTVLRRVPAAQWTRAGRREAQERLSTALEEVTVKPLDEDVADLIRTIPGLAGCRALDAAHLATALYFGAAADSDLRVCTFDTRMAQVARGLGLEVNGSNTP